MNIIEITENKKEYLTLLLLADEQEDMIDRYLDNGRMYVLDDNGIMILSISLYTFFSRMFELCSIL